MIYLNVSYPFITIIIIINFYYDISFSMGSHVFFQDFFSTLCEISHERIHQILYATVKWTTRPKTKMYTKQDGVENAPP